MHEFRLVVFYLELLPGRLRHSPLTMSSKASLRVLSLLPVMGDDALAIPGVPLDGGNADDVDVIRQLDRFGQAAEVDVVAGNLGELDDFCLGYKVGRGGISEHGRVVVCIFRRTPKIMENLICLKNYM